MTIENKFCICQSCLKEIHLKNYCKKKGDLNIQCSICESKEKGIAIDEENKEEISNLFRSCLRFNYREIEYNSKLDKTGLFDFFSSENSLVSHQFKNSDNFHDLISLLFQSDNKNDVKIYRGIFKYNNTDHIGQFHDSLKNQSSDIWLKLKKRLKKENYYNIQPDLEQSLIQIVDKTKIKIKKGRRFYRARIGNDSVEESDFSVFKKPIPFQDSEISAPPPLKSSAGRLNREGIAYLYLSSKTGTAISEIRPNPGDIISVGEFKCLNTIDLIDLRRVNLLKFIKSQKDIERFSFALNLSKEFMKPKTDINTYQYLITQFVAETFREIGQDGVIYNSAVSNGYNFTIFNPDLFEFVPNSSSLHRIKKVSFKSQQIEFTKNKLGFYIENEL